MADIRNQRSRPGVRIYLHPYDIADIVLQADVLAHFTEEELSKISEGALTELNYRQNKCTEKGETE